MSCLAVQIRDAEASVEVALLERRGHADTEFARASVGLSYVLALAPSEPEDLLA
jgi:hypothetical protein